MRSWGDHLDAVAKPILNLQHMHYGKGMPIVELRVKIFKPASLAYLKFRYSEKATKFEKIFRLTFDTTE